MIKDICKILKIDCPKISYDTSHFQSKTMLAQYNFENDTIYLKNTEKNIDNVFAISHELRHKWQFLHNADYYFADYKPRSELNLIEYNLQAAELDANAFTVIILSKMFGVKPIFPSEEISNAVEKQIPIVLRSLL